jgi:hypothetical protein
MQARSACACWTCQATGLALEVCCILACALRPLAETKLDVRRMWLSPFLVVLKVAETCSRVRAGAAVLARALPHLLARGLRTLHLARCQLGDRGVASIGAALASALRRAQDTDKILSCRLATLDLGQNGSQVCAAQALAGAVKLMPDLERFCCAGNSPAAEGVILLMSALVACRKLQVRNITFSTELHFNTLCLEWATASSARDS